MIDDTINPQDLEIVRDACLRRGMSREDADQVIETCILETFDPLKREDRKKNAHMLIVGPTGSGKSATVNAILLHALAVHRPRVFIIDAGGSFDLFGAHCERLGLTVHPGPGTT